MNRKPLTFGGLILGVISLLAITGAAIGAIVLSHLSNSRADQASYYVSPNGSDTNPGTQQAPFQTLQHAASVATAGATMHVEPGTYSTGGTLTINPSGTSAAPITFLSDVPQGAKIVSSNPSVVVDIEGSNVVFQGFDLTDTNPSAYAGVRIAGSYNKVVGNYIHDISTANPTCPDGEGGIYDAYQSGGHDNDEIANLIARIGPRGCGFIHGIYKANQGGHVLNNIIAQISGYGIHCWHACTGITVANNTVLNSGSGGMTFGDGDAPANGNSLFGNSIVSNNISVNNNGYGIREYEYSGQNTIGANNQFLNNLVYGNSRGGFSLLNGNTAQHTIAADPQLVNYQADGTGDYHLQAGSPAIGAGTSIGAPSTDFSGILRLPGIGDDIGAYAYGVAGTPTQSPTPMSTPLPIATQLPATPAPISSANLLQNGSFELGRPPWRFQTDSYATFTISSSTAASGSYGAQIRLPQADRCDCAVQLYQSAVALTAGHKYTLTFSAKGSGIRGIRPAVSHAASPWTTYFNQSVSINTQWQQFTLTFTAPASDSNAVVIFNLGNASGTVWIDNVALSS
jgi:hypothetical protein